MPVTAHLRHDRAGSARGDVVAGVTVAALALPSSMAYAEVAGVPVNGLYALLLPSWHTCFWARRGSWSSDLRARSPCSSRRRSCHSPSPGAPDARSAAMLGLCRGIFLLAWVLASAGSPTTSPGRCWSDTSPGSPWCSSSASSASCSGCRSTRIARPDSGVISDLGDASGVTVIVGLSVARAADRAAAGQPADAGRAHRRRRSHRHLVGARPRRPRRGGHRHVPAVCPVWRSRPSRPIVVRFLPAAAGIFLVSFAD